MSGTTQILYRQPYGLYLRQEALRQSWLVCQSELRDVLLSRAGKAAVCCPKHCHISALNCYLMSFSIYHKRQENRSDVVLEIAFQYSTGSFICVIECFKFSQCNLFKRRINVGSQGHNQLSLQLTGTWY